MFPPEFSNPVDSPSRILADPDASLDMRSWNLVDSTFGPHTIDLMALPSNVKLDRSGLPLKFSVLPVSLRTGPGNQCLFSSVIIQRKRLCVSTIHTYWPALEVPGVATIPFYNDCPRCLAQEILVAPPPASDYRCIQIGPKGG